MWVSSDGTFLGNFELVMQVVQFPIIYLTSHVHLHVGDLSLHSWDHLWPMDCDLALLRSFASVAHVFSSLHVS